MSTSVTKQRDMKVDNDVLQNSHGGDHCVICLDRIEQPSATLLLPCGHLFHWKCLKTYVAMNGKDSTCPICRHNLRTHTIYIQDIDEYHYPRVSIPFHDAVSNENGSVHDITERSHKNKFVLTIYASSSTVLTNDTIYVPNTFCTDHLIIERLDDQQRTPITETNANTSITRNQHLLLASENINTRVRLQIHRQYSREGTISCFCKCVLFTLNRCCECLAIGIVISVTYSVIYLFKHVVARS